MTEAPHPDEVRDAPQTSSNQARTEPIPPGPAAVPDPGDTPAPDATGRSVAPGSTAVDLPGKSTAVDLPVPSPGFISDEHGNVAVSTHAARGTSEELGAAQGVATTAIAQPGKPDGEVAT